MSGSNYQVRRATVDDLVVLRRFWQQAQWSVTDLEQRWREFQVVETVEGDVLGAIGLQVEQQQGKLHHESYKIPELIPQLRQRLWERVLSLAQFERINRLWILQGASMFWLENGFEAASGSDLETLPVSLAEATHAPWLTTKLRDPAPATRAAEQELAIYRVYQQQQEQKVMRQTRLLRLLAGILTVAVLLLVLGAAIFIWRNLKLHPTH